MVLLPRVFFCCTVILCLSIRSNEATDQAHSKDTRTSDLILQDFIAERVIEERLKNEDLPFECRTDVCFEYFTADVVKGDIYLPSTLVGMRRFVRCQFAYNVAAYAHADCRLFADVGVGGIWRPVNDSDCPGPPMHELFTEYAKSNVTGMEEDRLAAIHDIIVHHGADPVFWDDILEILNIMENFLKKRSIYSKDLAVLFEVADFLISPSLNIRKKNYGDYVDCAYRLLQILKNATYRLLPESAPGQLNMLGLHASVVTTNHFGPFEICRETDNCPAQTSLILNTQDSIVRTLFVWKVGDFPSQILQPRQYGSTTPPLPAHTVDGGQPVRRSISPDETAAISDLEVSTKYPPVTLRSRNEDIARKTDIRSRPMSPANEEDLRDNSSDEWFPEYLPVVTQAYIEGAEAIGSRKIAYELSMIPPLLYVHAQKRSENMTSVAMEVVEVRFNLNASGNYIEGTPGWSLCGILKEEELHPSYREHTWNPDRCRTHQVGHIVTCQCNNAGYLALFSSQFDFGQEALVPIAGPESGVEQLLVSYRMVATFQPLCRYNSIFNQWHRTILNLTSVLYSPIGLIILSILFLTDSHFKQTMPAVRANFCVIFPGFAFTYEVYVLSHVLRALSLVCLLLTCISFLVFRHARRGTPTRILMNLCVALIILNIVIYIAELIAESKMGCRASNILRYYLILVSLMWNGVEALNMYLMLVKVFNSDISRFTTKAALGAWGIPLLAIVTLLSIHHKSFDGYYIDCKFRCLLKPPTLHYGLFVPMGAIILINIIMFAIVFRVVVRHNFSPVGVEGQKKVWLKRLIRAVALLVLLGVPWIFAGFGAIDADSNTDLQKLEGIFQVVFVILVNGQGIYIFLFHCARNAEMRGYWKSSFYSLSHRQSTVSTSDVTPGSKTTTVIDNKTTAPPLDDNIPVTSL